MNDYHEPAPVRRKRRTQAEILAVLDQSTLARVTPADYLAAASVIGCLEGAEGVGVRELSLHKVAAAAMRRLANG